MEKAKKVGLLLLDIIEIGIPVAALCTTFVAFIVNVVSRYIIHKPVNACYELCLMGLLWCLLYAGAYAVRKHTNITFTLLYDMASARLQLVFRLVGTGFLIFCLAVMLYPCFDWVMFMQRKYTPVLKIPMHIVYSPFVAFNVLSLGHLIYDFVKDVLLTIRVVTGKEELVKEANMVTDAEALEKEGGDEA